MSEPESIGAVLQKSPTLERAKVCLSNEQWAAEDAERKERHRAEEAERLWRDVGVDARHAKQHSADLVKCEPWAAAVEKALRLFRAGAPILAFLGDRGNGKTQAAVHLIHQAVGRLVSARYMRCRQVSMMIRSTYRPDSRITESEALEDLVKPGLLVLDECQERFDTDHELRTLTLLLDMRYGAMKPTILIANCTPEAFEALMGPAVIDRMREGGGVLLFDWPSFRGNKGEGAATT